MQEKRISFGKIPDGREARLYHLENSNGVVVTISDVAAALVSVFAPDRNGITADVVLGYDNAAGYWSKGPYHGAVVGRVANRIEDATFTLNGTVYSLTPNYQGRHVLHGGVNALDHKLYQVEKHTQNQLMLSTTMADGEDGFPGNVALTVTYTLADDNGLSIQYHATSDADTPMNLTNHAYFNLAGAGSVLDHTLQIFSDCYTPLNRDGMVYGVVEPVDDVMDFTSPKPIGRDLQKSHVQLKIANGYDHNYVLTPNGKTLCHAASVWEEASGRTMDVWTNSPGILLYTGNFLADHNVSGKPGRCYENLEGFCLETNFYPNALKFQNFPQPILRSGETWDYETIYRFGVR